MWDFTTCPENRGCNRGITFQVINSCNLAPLVIYKIIMMYRCGAGCPAYGVACSNRGEQDTPLTESLSFNESRTESNTDNSSQQPPTRHISDRQGIKTKRRLSVGLNPTIRLSNSFFGVMRNLLLVLQKNCKGVLRLYILRFGRMRIWSD